jgi:hypothetical protein
MAAHRVAASEFGDGNEMRHLFVPACLCLMTLSGATGPELSLENLSGSEAGAPALAAVSADARSETAQGPAQIAIADIPIDIPPQAATWENSEPVPAYLPPLVPIVKPIIPRSRAEICDGLTAAAQSNDLPVPFFIRLLFQESGFRPGTVSHAGAEGIAQFMPETSASRGLDNPYDPLQAIEASARLLRELAQQFGNFGLAAAAYNAGPKRVQDWLAKKGKLPQETQGYVKIITGRPAETWRVTTAGTPEMRLPRRAPCQEAAGLHAWNGPARIPVPRPSPFTLTVSAPLQAAMQTAASTVTIKQHPARMTAIIINAKPTKAAAARSTKGTIQLAARKQPANKTKLDHKPDKMDRKTAGKPLKLAMMARSSHK